MKVRLKFNSSLPGKFKATGITLYPYVYISLSKEYCPRWLIKHELIHVGQIEETGWLKWYTDYCAQYIKFRIKGECHTLAYRHISYEIEAYAGQYGEFTERDYEILHDNKITRWD